MEQKSSIMFVLSQAETERLLAKALEDVGITVERETELVACRQVCRARRARLFRFPHHAPGNGTGPGILVRSGGFVRGRSADNGSLHTELDQELPLSSRTFGLGLRPSLRMVLIGLNTTNVRKVMTLIARAMP
jgi:hypothetical protein